MADWIHPSVGNSTVTRQCGFTLLEILVALTLFAVVGGALLQLFQDGLRQTSVSTERIHASMLARSKLTELLAFDTLRPGEVAGDFDEGYRWHLSLTEASELRAPGLVAMTPLNASLSVSWGPLENEKALTIHTLLLARRRP